MRLLKTLGFLVLMTTAPHATPNNPNTDWFSQAKYGVFMHFLPTGSTFPAAVNNFGVDSLAEQLQECGAAYFVITLGQNSGYMCSPNRPYDSLTGYAAGSHCSTRDLPMELANALIPRGIKLMLYLPAQPPNEDTHAQSSFGLTPQAYSDRPITATCATRWALVIQEWADRYGEKVSGWWFDGCYDNVISGDESIFQKYAAALKHGNPRSICAFNPGTDPGPRHLTDYEDYIAGEIEEGTGAPPSSRWLDGSQWHALAHLGSEWGGTDMALTVDQWITFLKACSAKQGVVSLDVGKNPNGTICASHFSALKSIRSALRTATPANGPAPRKTDPFFVSSPASAPVTCAIDGRSIPHPAGRAAPVTGICIVNEVKIRLATQTGIRVLSR